MSISSCILFFIVVLLFVSGLSSFTVCLVMSDSVSFVICGISSWKSFVTLVSLFDSMVNIVAVIPVYNTYGILNLVTKGILTIPLINSTLSVLLYNLFKTSILKLKED